MNNMLPTPYQQFIHKSRYARWIDGEERRENWDETVDRYIDFMQSQVEDKCNVKVDLGEVREAVLSLQGYAVHEGNDDFRASVGS